jgi:flotillin
MQEFLTALVIILVALIVLFVMSYVKVRPDKAVIITGPRGSRIVTGKATIRIPFIQRIDYLPLDLIQVDIRTSSAVPTNEFINIFVDGVANIKIQSDEASIRLAGEIFLTRSLEDVKQIAKEVLEGNMREIIGQMKLRELVQNRDKFAEQVKLSALADMKKMGLDIVNITIQNFADKNGVIDDLGVDNIAQIRKDASIARANSEKEVEIATSKAKELANDARIKAELEISQQNNSLALRQAELKQKADIAKATADASYEIQFANEAKTINISKQNAEIARRDKEIELRGKEVEVEEKTLEARIKKAAEAERYAREQKADAELYVRTKEAEALLAEQERAARGLKLQAEAEKYAQEQKAIGIQAVGLAEAEAIEKKAEAMKKMESAAVLELVLKSEVLPNIVRAAAEPLTQVDKIVMYGDGNNTKLMGDIVNSSTKVLESVKEATGLDLASLLAGFATGKMTQKDEPKE